MLNILCGKSGCGKDTLLNELKKEGYIPLVSTTSRPMREGETQGVEYNFISKDEFKKRIANDEFIEYRVYETKVNGISDTWYYGIPKQEFAKDKEYVVILDVGGTKDFLKEFGKSNILVCYIETDDKLREERAKLRGSFDQSQWNRRLINDNFQFAPDVMEEIADIHIENNDLSVEELKSSFINKISHELENRRYDAEKESFENDYETELKSYSEY